LPLKETYIFLCWQCA